MKYIKIFLFLILFVSCSQNQVFLNEQNFGNESFFHTKKATFLKDGHRILFILTYLNGLEKNELGYDDFVLEIYPKKSINSFSISLKNSKDKIILKKLDNTSYKLDNLPFANKWGEFYSFSLSKTNKKYLDIIIKIDEENQASLVFQAL